MTGVIKLYITPDGRNIYKIDGLPDLECDTLAAAMIAASGDKDAKVTKTESLQAGGGGSRSESVHRG
jgi:hypothetical protein|tara:strand:- start:4739 stop:4939 length:201 start_codon:yes stop_codon:yes gene_type:complete